MKKKALIENTKRNISSHAVERYLSRTRGLDIEAVLEEILPSAYRKRVSEIKLGEVRVIRPDGEHWLLVRGGVVTSVTTEPQLEKATFEIRP